LFSATMTDHILLQIHTYVRLTGKQPLDISREINEENRDVIIKVGYSGGSSITYRYDPYL